MPAASIAVWNVVTPFAATFVLPIFVAPSRKFIVPASGSAPPVVTVAVNSTLVPAGPDVGDAVSAVVVGAIVTF